MTFGKTITALGIIVCLGAFNSSAPIQTSRSHLAITLMPHYPNSSITYGQVKVRDGEIIKHNVISEKSFVLIASGNMKNESNPFLENLFEKHQIPNCSVHYNEPFRKFELDCTMLNRVWRVRYDTLPGHGQQASVREANNEYLGWASGIQHPSDGQMEILKKYGIRTVSNAIYGDSLWTFLRDINNPAWINDYRSR